MSTPQIKPLVVILLGPPGSGKGTHAAPLSRELSIPHISTGDLFRENIRNRTPLGLQAKNYIDIGHLVPDELVLDLLFDRVGKSDCAQGYILDGFPRTLPQARQLDLRLARSNRVIVFNFQLSDEKIIERTAGRIACKGCGRPYHQKFDPPKRPMECDLGCGPLIQRDDDREEIIRKRLDVYRLQTEPLIHYYSEQPDILRPINSDKPKGEVFQALLESLPLNFA